MTTPTCFAPARSVSVFAAVATLLLFFALPAKAAAPVEDFVTAQIQSGLSILADQSLTSASRKVRIHDFLLSLLDTQRIALYALGPAKNTARQADIDSYCAAFREFMAASYASRLGGYDGQTLKVTGSTEHAPGDYVVFTQLADPADPPGTQEPNIDLRVVGENGKFYVVDASIEGIWLGLAQQSDFQGFLHQHNNDVAALTAYLKDMTTKLESTGN